MILESAGSSQLFDVEMECKDEEIEGLSQPRSRDGFDDARRTVRAWVSAKGEFGVVASASADRCRRDDEGGRSLAKGLGLGCQDSVASWWADKWKQLGERVGERDRCDEVMPHQKKRRKKK